MEERGTVVSMLSSQTGDSTQQSNENVALMCKENPTLLKQIAEGLLHSDVKLAGDCAEVFTKVAETHPHLVTLYAEQLLSSIHHKHTRVRWESMHAVAFISPLIASRIIAVLDEIQERMFLDQSTIVKDYSILCLGNVASCGEVEAKMVLPILKQGLIQLGDKFISKVLTAMIGISKVSPSLAVEVLMYGYDYETHPKSSVQKAAKKLVKAAQ
ncbi:hypothetical protein SAMN04487969_1066 [Paenibacillus algorifonticola]|uniref:HEAT repeat-containing protein n=1 Tax=Paenibacillus algorifonticola TaxID=684063 RepID=A0A1I2CZF2_9BACL|nr:hypothetical protein [Paenibacillus algorifonticola]SFE73644.1 hypothetical protein SAMN04487969_1066 [Paenibacillus algorifonticola]